jgi:hypothetical protein
MCIAPASAVWAARGDTISVLSVHCCTTKAYFALLQACQRARGLWRGPWLPILLTLCPILHVISHWLVLDLPVKHARLAKDTVM